MTKKLILIAAIAVMLAGATSAYGYFEVWNGWFNSGELTLTLDRDYTFDYVSGEGTLEDTTNGDVDEFAIYAIPALTFTCTSTGWTIRLWAAPASGWKYTGQSGQKEAYDGAWSGYAILTRPPLDPMVFDTVEGTWDTDDLSDYFNYGGRPPIYSAEWDIIRSVPDSLDGVGGSEGYRVYPE